MGNPYELALRDFCDGAHDAQFSLERSDGWSSLIPIERYFRKNDLPPLEAAAIKHCKGRVLDAGAGTGRHSLLLSELGLTVVSIDTAFSNYRMMRQRGVVDPRYEDLFDLQNEAFDTILLLNRGLGMCQRLSKFIPMLNHLAGLLAPKGRVVADSTVIDSSNFSAATGYAGDVRLRIGYRGQLSGWFDWLYLDEKTLVEKCVHAGWSANVIFRDGQDYLSVLTPGKAGGGRS